MASLRYTSEAASPEPLAQPLVFQPSGRTAKNRFLKSPMAESLASWSPTVPSERGVPTDELAELYARWGEGKDSWGVIVTGNVDIEFDSLDGPADMIITPECAPEGKRFEAFKKIADAGKKDGSLIVAQVTHPGRQVQARVNPVAISASDVQLEPKMGMTFGKPHAATKTELARVVEGFAHAAEYLHKAGFDGIELHAAHGYLLSQFLSRTTNKRSDEYGAQTIESRLRLISEVAAAIKARVPASFIVAAKLNSVEFQDGGVTPAEAAELCERLESLGFDFVELSGGTYEALGLVHEKESTRKREGFFLEWAEALTSSLGRDRKMKTYIVGGLRSVGAMVKALDAVDGIAMGRPAAAEPRLPADIISGRVTGALKPTDAVEADFGLGMGVALAQIAQVAKGEEPLRHGDAATMETFGADMGAWYQKVVQDGAKMEFIRAVEYSGPKVAYGTVDVAK
ncbi:hypothetical protein B0J13DRAFT_629008 [Dactylonectria estremocensis]|uniref:NADH:flavin oxidoreductase/NADH oxidase N-terminal domain-containing protein n=1 Tax=Dactylonectria estremocensis TaxID=1079267 RepID=A0A9P9DMF8_9HYPO|nr:hypothetical protein B0J13DRAFT_629008 [Dactylonectria estremocensis]